MSWSYRSRRRALLLTASLVGLLLVLPVGVLALRGSAEPSGDLSAAFVLGPDPLPPGSAGGSELTTSAGGHQASLTLWVPGNVPTYFLDVLEFRFGGPAGAQGRLNLSLAPGSGPLPRGAELYALMGTPAPGASPGGTLGSGPAVPGGSLLAIAGLGGPEAGLTPMFTAVDLTSNGVQVISPATGTSFSLAPGTTGLLVLDVGLFLPGGAAPVPSALTISVLLTPSG
jgi:hypothetical protein